MRIWEKFRFDLGEDDRGFSGFPDVKMVQVQGGLSAAKGAGWETK
jgi:hypothetical protein